MASRYPYFNLIFSSMHSSADFYVSGTNTINKGNCNCLIPNWIQEVVSEMIQFWRRCIQRILGYQWRNMRGHILFFIVKGRLIPFQKHDF